MKVFLDTNILLDFGLEREKADFAGGILQLGKEGLIELYASYLIPLGKLGGGYSL